MFDNWSYSDVFEFFIFFIVTIIGMWKAFDLIDLFFKYKREDKIDMALSLKKYSFCVTDYSLIFAKGTSADDKKKNDPLFVKIFGFALDSEMNTVSCYIMEDFKTFNMDKSTLLDHLVDRSVLIGTGIVMNDNNYFHRLQFTDFSWNPSWNFEDIVHFD